MTTDYTQSQSNNKVIHKNSYKSQVIGPRKKKTLSSILKNAKSSNKSLSNVFYLKMIKSKLELLPSKTEYQLYLEADYLRNVS
jgi:restriction endonuclease S subunit